jgi:hypothetical protein
VSPRARSRLALALASAVAAGCAAAPSVSPQAQQARASREAFFQDNLATWAARSPEEAAALDVLRRFKRAHDHFDARALEPLLAPGFEARYYPSRDRAEVQSRAAYLEQRRQWTSRPAPARTLVIAVQASHLSRKTGQLAVTALTTHRSKHFAPRFLETFVLERLAGEWRLHRLMTYPMRPPGPAFHDVAVVFTDMATPETPASDAIARDMLAEGPDSVFDKHYRLGSTRRSNVRALGAAGPFVVIFREPPPDGARIEIVEQAYGPVTESARGVVVAGAPPSPFFYVVSTNRWWGSGYRVEVRVLLDGVQVAEETLTLQ